MDDFRLVFAYAVTIMASFMRGLPDYQHPFVICCKCCRENIPAPVQTIPDTWIIHACPKLGPSLLISTCLILAIRAAKSPATFDKMTGHPELDKEIEYASYLASRVLSSLVSKKEVLFPQKKTPWYETSDEDVPK